LPLPSSAFSQLRDAGGYNTIGEISSILFFLRAIHMI
jgi:hypothetical protein